MLLLCEFSVVFFVINGNLTIENEVWRKLGSNQWKRLDKKCVANQKSTCRIVEMMKMKLNIVEPYGFKHWTMGVHVVLPMGFTKPVLIGPGVWGVISGGTMRRFNSGWITWKRSWATRRTSTRLTWRSWRQVSLLRKKNMKTGAGLQWYWDDAELSTVLYIYTRIHKHGHFFCRQNKLL